MVYSVPVVASDIGGVPECLREGQNGFRLPPKAASAIAERVRTIVENPELARSMGHKALEYLNERFLPEQHLSALMQIYEGAL